MDQKAPTWIRQLQFGGGPLEDGTVRPTVSLYLEHELAGPDTGSEPPQLRLLSVTAGVQVDDWEIGREIGRENGVLRAIADTKWRRLGRERWASDATDGGKPTRVQMRAGTIEPYLDGTKARHRGLMSEMLAEARSLYPDWTEQMATWPLTRIKGGRGLKRAYDSADGAKQPDDDNDTFVAHRVGVSEHAPPKRRQRDRQSQLAPVPWAITANRLERLGEVADELCSVVKPDTQSAQAKPSDHDH